jgi:hypothetical protein
MRRLNNLLLASGSLLGMAGCISDFSPDPLKSDLASILSDAGSGDASSPKDGGNGGSKDATAAPPEKDGSSPPVGDTGTPPSGGTGCNLAGRWFINEHLGTDVIGAIQIANNWFYVEITQEGDTVTFAKSVGCGCDLNGASNSVGAHADDSSSWPAYLVHPSYEGRKGTVKKTADGCSVQIDRDTHVKGATVATYKDWSIPLPMVNQPAANGQPGWEDWDNDSNPGFSMDLSGLAKGTIYLAARTWTEYSGTIPEGATAFKLDVEWEQVRAPYGASVPDPIGILQSIPGHARDQSLQLVEFAKLTDEQAAGDDAARCERLRALAPTITPNASKF